VATITKADAVRFAILALMVGGLASGHQIAEMPLSLEVAGDRVFGVIEADAAYMLTELRGDDDEDPKDLAWLRDQGPAGWTKIVAESEAYWRDCLRLEADGVELSWRLRIPALEGTTPPLLAAGEPEDPPLVNILIEASLPPATRRLEALWHEPFGVVLIVTTGRGDTAETTPIVSGERVTLAERAAVTSGMRPATPSWWQWVGLGFVHILPRGADHILFVIGLFLLRPEWRPLLQQTLLFTLAHSLSLAAAALGWLRVPAAPVEILIAASIAWVGIGNSLSLAMGKSRLGLVAVFGLIHGLGFAGVLGELLPADQAEKLPVALLGFNVGVELGQVVVLAAAFGCFAWMGGRFDQTRRTGSWIVAAAGLVLLAERISGVEILPFL